MPEKASTGANMCVGQAASSELSAESRGLAARMFRAPVDAFSGMSWPKSQAADLRKLLIQILQRHIEKKLVTAGMLERVD